MATRGGCSVPPNQTVRCFGVSKLSVPRKVNRKLKNPWNDGPTLGSAQKLKRFQRREHIEFLKSSKIILENGVDEVCKHLLDNVPVTLRRLGQYSLLQDLDAAYHISNIIHYGTLGLVDKAKKGRKKGKLINLSTHMMESIIDALLQNQGHLAHGERSLRSNGVSKMLSWACQAGDDDEMVTHNILVWHVTTTMCKHHFDVTVANYNGTEEQFSQFSSKYAITASGLSYYCAYLVAFLPDLLPGHSFETASILAKSIEEARRLRPLQGAKTMDKKCDILLRLPYDRVHMNNPVILGARFANELLRIDKELRWKVLSNFWAEMILYVAPPCDYSPGEGEFITHMWALLLHAGVLEQGPDEPPTVDTFSM